MLELLEWHGHSSGGVRVPFSPTMGRPLKGAVIETPIIDRLEDLALQISMDEPWVRFVFLVGGPGNGKSDAVEHFIRQLDALLGCSGGLVAYFEGRYNAPGAIPRRVDATAATIGGEQFDRLLGNLIVVQDASSAPTRADDAATLLANEITDLVSTDGRYLYLCCINRGILAKARDATSPSAAGLLAHEILGAVADATSVAAIATDLQPPSWPVRMDRPDFEGRVAAWPLDLESLLAEPASDASPLGQILGGATDEASWDAGPCGPCEAAPRCPLLRNAQNLRLEDRQESLRKSLRRAELGAGKRWNFRELYSLVAEVVIGEWEDFEPAGHPCDWVHGMSKLADEPSVGARASALHHLTRRLYEQALFPFDRLPGLKQKIASPAVEAIAIAISDRAPTPEGRIRLTLGQTMQPLLDPAATSPADRAAPLHRLEDGFSQSVELGMTWWSELAARGEATPPGELEHALLTCLVAAEADLDFLARDSLQPVEASAFLRVYAAAIAKRAVGVPAASGGHPDLFRYEGCLRDEMALDEVRQGLVEFLGSDKFEMPATAAFGQVAERATSMVTLVETRRPRVGPVDPAPVTSPRQAGHDLPLTTIEGRPIAITYDLFKAVEQFRAGCSSGSLPASVRARFDLIRQLQAGRLAHDAPKFASLEAEYRLGGQGTLHVSAGGDVSFRVRRATRA